MTTLQILVLALVQGLTEFLPVSSSGHLILIPELTGWPDQGLAFDVAAHLGSLIAVCAYFRHDLVRLTADWSRSVTTRRLEGDAKIAWAVLFGTIPVGLVGLIAGDLVDLHLRSPAVIALATVFFGAALWWADSNRAEARGLASISPRDVLIIGCAQALALIPGTSRSGITMTAAMALGLSREAAARFSFLLSIPVIVLAGGLKGLELATSGEPQPWLELAAVVVLAAASAYACIHWFLAVISRIGMLPFALYRFALGAVLWWWVV